MTSQGAKTVSPRNLWWWGGVTLRTRSRTLRGLARALRREYSPAVWAFSDRADTLSENRLDGSTLLEVCIPRNYYDAAGLFGSLLCGDSRAREIERPSDETVTVRLDMVASRLAKDWVRCD